MFIYDRIGAAGVRTDGDDDRGATGGRGNLLRAALATVLTATVATGEASAHVDYVTEDTGEVEQFGRLLASATEPMHLALLAGGGLAAGAAVAGYWQWGRHVPDVGVARSTLASYRPYLPWMLRLSLGLPLVGAGFSGYLFTPSVPGEARLLQVAIGFLLLFGLAVRAVAAVGLLAYLWVLVTNPVEAPLAFEYAGGFLAIVLAGAGQPSADLLVRRLRLTDGTLVSRHAGGLLDRLRAPTERLPDREWVPVAIRAAMGLNFVFLGVTQKLLDPGRALAVVAKYDLTAVVPVAPEMWVFGAGVAEVAVGLALLAGVFTRGVAAVAFLLFSTTLFGLPDDPVVAHISLFGLASALLVTGSGPLSVDEWLSAWVERDRSSDATVGPGAEPGPGE
jgi:uncharacterized membrane protein YphA (DoxX/SURF4 family)